VTLFEAKWNRSFATREANVSLSRAAADAVTLLRSAGFPWIFLETGGIGQADTSIVGLADAHVYVMTAEFGGKDPSKVDRSGAYAARYIAKNIVAAGLATKCEVGLAYVIGQPKPLMQTIDTFGTATVSYAELFAQP
jgi:hypothetical protein